MILGKYKLKNWTHAKTVGTTKLSDGVEVLGKLNERYIGSKRVIEATQYGDKIQALSAISNYCLLYTSPSPRDGLLSRMPSSA